MRAPSGIPARPPGGIRGERGQMTVELAAVMPVVIVVALIVANVVRFCCLCATFDRVALDAIVSQGVAPSGDQSEEVAVGEVRSAIEDALGDPSCAVEVTAEPVGAQERRAGRVSVSFAASLTRFTCTLRFHPWPASLSICGVSMGDAAQLTHERSLVVDRYRPGVVF